jgi:DNA-binding protein HU-beta
MHTSSIFLSITKAVAKGEDVRLTGFGTFTLVKRADCQGRNPRTGVPLKIPASKAPKFREGKEFKKVGSVHLSEPEDERSKS